MERTRGAPQGGKGGASSGPILKWAGGKTQLLGQILPRLPGRALTYFEPFVGGGAVFFALAEARRFERAVLSDTNAELVNLYRVVRDRVGELVAALTPWAERARDEEAFYRIRALRPETLDPAERAARLLFLNRTCFNGLYRVNRRGEFNVPFGRYENPRVLDPARLEAASRALRGVEIRRTDFAEIAQEAGPGDAVYFDPPYAPVSATASFTAYQADAFPPEAQERLVEVYVACWSRGATAVMSNSDCELTRRLYARFDVEVVRATRAINSAADRRGAVNELLVVGPGAAAGAGAARARSDSTLPAGAAAPARSSCAQG